MTELLRTFLENAGFSWENHETADGIQIITIGGPDDLIIDVSIDKRGVDARVLVGRYTLENISVPEELLDVVRALLLGGAKLAVRRFIGRSLILTIDTTSNGQINAYESYPSSVDALEAWEINLLERGNA